jgi:hypothetical protein
LAAARQTEKPAAPEKLLGYQWARQIDAFRYFSLYGQSNKRVRRVVNILSRSFEFSGVGAGYCIRVALIQKRFASKIMEVFVLEGSGRFGRLAGCG